MGDSDLNNWRPTVWYFQQWPLGLLTFDLKQASTEENITSLIKEMFTMRLILFRSRWLQSIHSPGYRLAHKQR